MYLLVKIWVRTGLQLYCSNVHFDTKHLYKGDSPLILACSHPNSFFDALILGAYHPRRLYFLARGDAFINPRAAKVLRMLNMIPIYRMSEGRDNLDNNQQTFSQCIDILKKNGAVLIFSEGVSVNEWRLRPLMKGTARLACMCWQDHDIADLVIQPTGINYHSFKEVPKRVHVTYGPVIGKEGFELSPAQAFYKSFNTTLTNSLAPLVMKEGDILLQKKVSNSLLKFLLALPALVGYLLHRPLYNWWKGVTSRKTKGTVFYDSVLFAGLLIVYPILVLLLSIAVVLITGNAVWWLLMITLPFTAWSYRYYKSA